MHALMAYCLHGQAVPRPMRPQGEVIWVCKSMASGHGPTASSACAPLAFQS